jgi:hypothetical protein
MVETESDVMKFRKFSRGSIMLGGLVGLVACARSVAAQTDVPAQSPSAPGSVASSRSNSVQLPYGAADVLKLAHAGVGDDTIVAFVESTRSQYGLGASEILYLKDQGVSDRVVTAMLQNGKNSAPVAAQTAAPAAVTYSPQATVTYSPPAQTYVQSVPPEAPASTVYVIPNSQPTYVYSDYYYPTYGGWGGYYYPPVAFSFGFGGRFRDGGFQHGGFQHGGFQHGGFQHGGFQHGGFQVGGFHGGGSFGHHR